MPFRLGFTILSICLLAMSPANDDPLQRHVDAINSHGKEPVAFIEGLLKEHDLIVFDDAMHNAHEPWVFFGDLVKNKAIARELDYVFIEVIPRNYDYAIEEYLTAEKDDPTLLIPAFTNGLHGYGWRYQNTIDFIKTVREVNLSLPKEERIKVLGVAPPTYWEAMKTHEDWVEYDNFFYLVYDFAMYRHIHQEMDSFTKGKKGFFLTNTRHAYTNVRRKDGTHYWNTMTYFAQRHPGIAYSVRVHNASLYFVKKEDGGRSVSWVRTADGLWDSAFAVNENKPIGVPLADTVFGDAPYIGNHMLGSHEDTKMRDAYDAVVFIAPLESMRQCAYTDMLYTEEFKKELERRVPIRFSKEELDATMKQVGVSTIRELIDALFVASDVAPLPQAQALGPIEAWKK